MLLDENNPFGAVKAGCSLILRGLLFPVSRSEGDCVFLQPWLDRDDVINLNHNFDFGPPGKLEIDRIRLMPIVNQNDEDIHILIL